MKDFSAPPPAGAEPGAVELCAPGQRQPRPAGHGAGLCGAAAGRLHPRPAGPGGLVVRQAALARATRAAPRGRPAGGRHRRLHRQGGRQCAVGAGQRGAFSLVAFCCLSSLREGGPPVAPLQQRLPGCQPQLLGPLCLQGEPVPGEELEMIAANLQPRLAGFSPQVWRPADRRPCACLWLLRSPALDPWPGCCHAHLP